MVYNIILENMHLTEVGKKIMLTPIVGEQVGQGGYNLFVNRE